MLLNIIKINDKRIRFYSKRIFKINKIKKLFLIKRMILTMYENNGIGISSNQINYKKKIIIIDFNKKNKPLIIFNPYIFKKSNYYTLSTEGCLSIPKLYVSTPRSEKIFLEYINLYNKKKKKIYKNILARCLQHEIDHLFGILLIDYFKIIIYYE